MEVRWCPGGRRWPPYRDRGVRGAGEGGAGLACPQPWPWHHGGGGAGGARTEGGGGGGGGGGRGGEDGGRWRRRWAGVGRVKFAHGRRIARVLFYAFSFLLIPMSNKINASTFFEKCFWCL